MRNLTALGVLGLALGSLLFTSCTAKYQRMLDERDREIVALKDERSRLEVELRAQKEQEERLNGRLRVLDGERKRLHALLENQPKPAAPAARVSGADPRLRKIGEQIGIEVKERPEGTVLILPGSITFRSGSVSLSKRGRGILDKLAATLRREFSDRTLSVEGHSDSQPIRKSKFGTNWRLSAERAEAVRAYLTKKGVAGRKVRVVGYGPSQPVATNKAENGRKKNRRVELVILKA